MIGSTGKIQDFFPSYTVTELKFKQKEKACLVALGSQNQRTPFCKELSLHPTENQGHRQSVCGLLCHKSALEVETDH